MLTQYTLHGRLGRLFGSSYTLNVSSPAEGVRALCVLIPGLKEYLSKAQQNIAGYRLIAGRRFVELSELHAKSGCAEYHLFPVTTASAKKGVLQMVLGVVLIAAAVFIPAMGAGVTSLWGQYGAALAGGLGTTAQLAAMMGTGLIFGGISSLVANPKMGSLGSGDNSRSYIFNGSAQTSRQGGPIPVGYGRLHVGAQVISQGVTTSNEKRLSIGNTGVEPEDDVTGEGAYGSSDTQVTHVRTAGTANFIGAIDNLGNAQVPAPIDSTVFPTTA